MNNKINLPIREKVNAWHVQNPDAYRKFIRNFNKISETNMDFFRKLVMLISENIPEEIEELWQFSITGEDESHCNLLETYGEMLDRCVLENHNFSVNIASGEVQEHDNTTNLQLQQGEVLFSKQISDSIFRKMPRKVKGMFGFDGTNSESEDLMNSVFCILSAALIAVPKFIQNLISKRKQNYNFAYSLCYFMIFDHGLMKVQKKLSTLMVIQNWDMQSQMMGDLLTKGFVNTSVSHGYDTKADWVSLNKEEDEESSEVITATLSKVKGSGGRLADFGSIEEMLIGDKKQLIELISQFLEEETKTVFLAYLFYVLKETKHISVRDYKAFHRAIKMAFPDKEIKGVTKPQARYSEVLEIDKHLLADDYLKYKDYNCIKWKNAHKVINRWLSIFRSVN